MNSIFLKRSVYSFLILLAVLIFKESISIENYSGLINKSYGQLSPGGKEIPVTEANELISNYRNQHKEETDKSIYKTTGWQLNKTAIENILSNKDLKSLSFDLVEQEGKLKLIIHGTTSEMSEVENDIRSSVYISQSLCPTDCSGLIK